MSIRWDGVTYRAANVVQVYDAPFGRVMIRKITRGEFRIFINGERTSWSGDNMEEAKRIAEGIITARLAQESVND